MDASTWKAFCMAAANQPGYVPKTQKPMVLTTFECDRCRMLWKCGMKLEGEPHRALLNKCGGCWREYAAPRQPGSVVVEGTQQPPLKEEYEIDEG